MDPDRTRKDTMAISAAPGFDYPRSERDARAIIAADLFESAARWDAKAGRAARDGHALLDATCRHNAAHFRDRAHSLLERCP
jgi:hypothetical protein